MYICVYIYISICRYFSLSFSNSFFKLLQNPLYLSKSSKKLWSPYNLPDIIRMENKYYLCSQFSNIIEEVKNTHMKYLESTI